MSFTAVKLAIPSDIVPEMPKFVRFLKQTTIFIHLLQLTN